MKHRQFIQAITQALNNRPDDEIDQVYTQDQVGTVLSAAIQVITQSLIANEPINLTSLGKFSVDEQKQLVFPEGDNPALPPRRHVRFRAATALKTALNGSLIPEDRAEMTPERTLDHPQPTKLVDPPRIQRQVPPRILQNLRQRTQQRSGSRTRDQ